MIQLESGYLVLGVYPSYEASDVSSSSWLYISGSRSWIYSHSYLELYFDMRFFHSMEIFPTSSILDTIFHYKPSSYWGYIPEINHPVESWCSRIPCWPVYWPKALVAAPKRDPASPSHVAGSFMVAELWGLWISPPVVGTLEKYFTSEI